MCQVLQEGWDGKRWQTIGSGLHEGLSQNESCSTCWTRAEWADSRNNGVFVQGFEKTFLSHCFSMRGREWKWSEWQDVLDQTVQAVASTRPCPVICFSVRHR